MAENIISNLNADSLILAISSFTNLIVAFGGLILIYLVFNIINYFINRRKNKELKKINKNLEVIKNILSKKSKK